MTLAITMGDPAGVGPEVCLQLLARADEVPGGKMIIYGDQHVLDRVAEATGLPPAAPGAVRHLPALADPDAVVPGRVAAECGRASFTYIETAITAALEGEIDAVVTAPINKEALHAAGIGFPGHTEIFAARTDASRSCMLQYSDEVTAAFVTCHVGHLDVVRHLSIERVGEVIDLAQAALTRIEGKPPDMIACGLNPHAGENGLFGNREEERIIIPALEAARARGVSIDGPLPPDTCFIPSKRARTDCYICMYHDQGHIPLKALAFDTAVNVTLGLPIVRTSVDHGTAFDIAWQGKAKASSLIEAARLAVLLAERR